MISLDTKYCPDSTATGRDFYEYSEICINMALNATRIAHKIIKNSMEYPVFAERLEKQIECLEKFKVLKKND